MANYDIKWAVDIFNADAEKVYSEISSIGENVTPKDVLEYAKKNEDSELYKCFEWDDSIAAEKYRLQQAGTVIRTLYIVPKEDDAPRVRVLSKTSEVSTYKPTIKFLRQPDEYADLLKRAKAELEMFKSKYKTLVELESVFESIDEFLSI